MLKTCKVLFTRRLVNTHNLRFKSILQQGPDSYLYNPGSEPLIASTLGQVIAETCHKYPGRVAVKSIHEDVTITYEELLNQADSLGCALRENGFKKGDRLGIWSHNNAGWVVALVAAARVGLITVLINPVYEKKELSFCLKKAQIKGLMIGDSIKNRDYYGTLRSLIPELQTSKGVLNSNEFPNLTSILTSGKAKLEGVSSLEHLVKSYQNNSAASKYGNEVKPEDGSIIHFTSGTTGDPKAALDSHYSVVNNTYFVGKRNYLHTDHQIVCIQVPLFHALGSVITVLGALRHGSTLVLASPFYDVTANINALCAEKCTVITGTPTMYVDMISKIQGREDMPVKLKVALAGGAPCSPQLIRQMNTYLKTEYVVALYGMTETTASVFQSAMGDGVDVVADTVGYIQDHVEVKVVNEKNETVPFGMPGELQVRGYVNMMGYWDEPEKTRQTIDEDGWLSTGDKFTISPDGYGRIVGRIKDIIVRGGENIAPKEIEDVLNTHPNIVESQVVGVSDERLGEELCAVLRLREGATISTKDIATHCSGQIARFKIPRILKTTETFPKTASGKIQKYRLKELIESGKL